MNAQEPPALAIWLLERFGSGSTRDVVAGDLVEQFTGGRSRGWLWRQVVVTIVVGNAREVWTHKLLALRAIAVGWAASYGLAKVYWVVLPARVPVVVVGDGPAVVVSSRC